jgi:GNAT superfamily N-acetyltransferase
MSLDSPGSTPAAHRVFRPFRFLRSAVELARRDGPVSLALSVKRHHIFDWRSFYLYELLLADCPAGHSGPQPDGYDECLVDSNEAADQSVAGRCDFREVMPWTRRALARGAATLCMYHGREVAHVGCVATSPAARRAIDALPFEVQFDRGEGLLGAAYTLPRHRGRGLMTYSTLRRLDYLRSAGFRTCKVAVATNNGPSNRVQMRLKSRICGVGCLFRLLKWRRWSERPATAEELKRHSGW